MYALSDLCDWMQAVCPSFLNVRRISIDSRLVQPGDLFFALKGEKSDGHAFLSEAIAKGAHAAVVENSYRTLSRQIPSDFPLIFVDDSLAALQRAAKGAVQKISPRIVAVTGSLGKTTAKDFMTTLVSQRFRTLASPSNQNSQVGLPSALLNHLKGNEEWLILEMGMSFPGEISRLLEIAPPDIAVITMTALVHACNFEDLQQIGYAKAEIFTHPNTKIGILDHRIVNFEALARVGSCSKISFAVDSTESDYSLDEEGEALMVRENQYNVQLPGVKIPGKHNLHNLLAACVVARQLGMEWEEIGSRFSALALPEKRLQIVEKKGVTFINDSYNAAEASMKAALELRPISCGRRAENSRPRRNVGAREVFRKVPPCRRRVCPRQGRLHALLRQRMPKRRRGMEERPKTG